MITEMEEHGEDDKSSVMGPQKVKMIKFAIGALVIIVGSIGLVIIVRALSAKDADKAEVSNAYLLADEGANLGKDSPKTYADRIIAEATLTKDLQVQFSDVVGQDKAKLSLLQNIILPNKRPDIFKGPRAPARGIMLFGPPGTGKTMLAKALSSALQAKFFAVSSSTFAAKYYGESERLMKALFDVARANQPAVIFIDELDSILRSRNSGDHEASLRVKTEFLVQTEGFATDRESKVFIIAATNRPQDLDDAVLRRFQKRILVDLPTAADREAILRECASEVALSTSDQPNFAQLAANIPERTMSCSDIKAICRSAVMRPIMDVLDRIDRVSESDIRPVTMADFEAAILTNRRSVSHAQLVEIDRWELEFAAL